MLVSPMVPIVPIERLLVASCRGLICELPMIAGFAPVDYTWSVPLTIYEGFFASYVAEK